MNTFIAFLWQALSNYFPVMNVIAAGWWSSSPSSSSLSCKNVEPKSVSHYPNFSCSINLLLLFFYIQSFKKYTHTQLRHHHHFFDIQTSVFLIIKNERKLTKKERKDPYLHANKYPSLHAIHVEQQKNKELLTLHLLHKKYFHCFVCFLLKEYLEGNSYLGYIKREKEV